MALDGLIKTPEVDKSLIGSVLGAVNMDQLVAGPLKAMVSAQVDASKSYIDFLTTVCIKDGKAVAVDFTYEETLLDSQGLPIYKKNDQGYLNNKNEIFLLVEQGNKEEATLKLEGAQKIFDAAKEELNSADDDNRSIAQEQFDKAVAELREAKKEFESSNVIVYKKASDNTVVTAAELPDILAEYGVAKTVYRTIKVPLMTMITHPSIAIEEGNITFDMSITQMAEDNSSNELNAETEMGIKHGPFTMGVKAKISHKSEQTRKTDTTAKYHVDVKVKRQDPPEALNKVLDLMMNGINPIRVAEPK